MDTCRDLSRTVLFAVADYVHTAVCARCVKHADIYDSPRFLALCQEQITQYICQNSSAGSCGFPRIDSPHSRSANERHAEPPMIRN